MNRSLTWAAVVLVVMTQSACTWLIPDEVRSEMSWRNSPTATPIASLPERFVYRIDDHRYVTIKGNRNCEGLIYYYDTRLGVRTAVTTTGLTLGRGEFAGYYAADSEYVVIPAIRFSNYSGSLLYIYYSHDSGKTFKRFLAGGYGGDLAVAVLTGKSLYLGRYSSDPQVGLNQARLFDVSQDIATGGDQKAIKPQGQWIDPHTVPLTMKSPSGSTRWKCGDPIAVK